MTEIRRVAADEWTTVPDIRLTALKDSPDWFWATYHEEAEKDETWWRRFIEVGAWFVAFDDENPVGIAAAIRGSDSDECDRQAISMWVAPQARKAGIGRRLIESLKEWARSERLRQLQLDVTDSNDAALRLYQRCGFRLTGRTTPHPRNARLMEREMRLSL